MEQGSEAWKLIRQGRATASEMNKIFTAGGRLSSQRIKYMRKLARETVIGDPLEWFGNKYTDWGNAHEEDARAAFAELTGLRVQPVGFVVREDEAPLGCSPDALVVDAEGNYVAGLEIKCPQVDTHVNYVLENTLPDDYRIQVHSSMAVTGLSHWFFMSYYPGLKPLILREESGPFTRRLSQALDQFVVEYAEERERVLKAILIPGEDDQSQEESEWPEIEQEAVLEMEESLI